jgi:hypothetical protein
MWVVPVRGWPAGGTGGIVPERIEEGSRGGARGNRNVKEVRGYVRGCGVDLLVCRINLAHIKKIGTYQNRKKRQEIKKKKNL